jgi:hypothetical protein
MTTRKTLPTRQYLLSLPLHKMNAGQEYASVPLHCTLMPWFLSDRTPQYFINYLLPIIEGYKAIELLADTVEMFGPKNDIRVHTVRRDSDWNSIILLHDDVFFALRRILVPAEKIQYASGNYRPHVMVQGDYALFPGQSAVIDAVDLIEKVGEKRVKVGELRFGFHRTHAEQDTVHLK